MFRSHAELGGSAAARSTAPRGRALVDKLNRRAWALKWYDYVLHATVDAQVTALRAAIREWKPDVLCADSLAYAAAIAGELENVPWASVSTMLTPLVPPGWSCAFLDILAELAPARDRIFEAHGVRARFNHGDVISPSLDTVFTTEAFIPRAGTGNDYSIYVGPSLPVGDRGDEPPFPGERLTGAPLVYVAFGSQLAAPPEVLAAVIDAIEPGEAQIVVSRIGLDTEEAREWPEHVIAVPYAPQLALLERGAVMVGHGGANSVAECLSRGTPMLVIPMTTDQPVQGMFVEQSGAGATLQPRDVTRDRVREALLPMFDRKGRAQTRASEIQESYARHDGAGRIAELLAGIQCQRG
jgi:MGT family glycosyltransferase